ncbi:MAG: BamA/TamA family outer membrane protein [Bacteroidales bacterium]|nr:MAG: BamA/TamA family outer membrane protein [Bacteroidales bacterium]
MKFSLIYKNLLIPFSKPILLIGFVILSSCIPTKYVPDNEYLLNKYRIENRNRSINRKDLEKVIKQKPNRRILGLKFHLSLYNLSRRGKDGKINNWLRTIGEEPVIYDEYQTGKSTSQLKTVLAQKGYFNAEVFDSVELRKKKARITYSIQSNEPYMIRQVQYDFEDTTLRGIVLNDTIASTIKPGEKYDVEILQRERDRLERLLRNEGYYTFSKHYVFFEIDSALGSNRLDIQIGIKNFQQSISGSRYRKIPHHKYRINRVYVYPNFNPQQALSDPDAYYAGQDTISYNGLYFITKEQSGHVKPKVVVQSNYIKEGELYNLTNVEQTDNHLSSLRVFRLINIQFEEVEHESDTGTYLLDCIIQLAPFTQQSYMVELEGTNSAGNLGGAVNLLYQHRNLFRGAEILNLKLKGALETLTEEYVDSLELEFQNTIELGAELNLTFPKFLLPFLEAERFVKKYDPKTTFSLAYNYQRRPVYTRTSANASIGYNWFSPDYSSHLIRPIDINAVHIHNIDTVYERTIKGTYLEYSYRDVFINGLNYSYIFNNQKINRKEDFIFFRLNMETAGNLVYGINQLANTPEPENSGYKLFGLEYAQFVKGDIDLRYNQVLNETNDLIYRISLGAAYPYGNSISVPFTEQFFSGGANGVRAWHVRSLGPGSTRAGENLFFNQTADIKLEANLEYRFKLFWILEGAWFLDAGNIWTIKEDKDIMDQDPAFFRWNKFYKDLAVGTGLGLRFDLSFFVFRLDLGMKLRDPQGYDIQADTEEGISKKWIIGNRGPSIKKDDFVLHFAIGYPF